MASVRRLNRGRQVLRFSSSRDMGKTHLSFTMVPSCRKLSLSEVILQRFVHSNAKVPASRRKITNRTLAIVPSRRTTSPSKSLKSPPITRTKSPTIIGVIQALYLPHREVRAEGRHDDGQRAEAEARTKIHLLGIVLVSVDIGNCFARPRRHNKIKQHPTTAVRTTDIHLSILSGLAM